MVVGVDWYGMGFPSSRLGVGVFGLAVGVFGIVEQIGVGCEAESDGFW